MGGDYYDRDMVPTTDTGVAYSDLSSKVVGVTNTIHSSLKPDRWAEEKLVCEVSDPIIFALDVTGSMGDWSRIIYDKMPMFYGQIMQQEYLRQPALSFCAIGDVYSDSAPLQVSEFGQGKEIDQLISKIYLEGRGGGGFRESYEVGAYFYNTRIELVNAETPFLFITGDEAFYETIPIDIISKFIGVNVTEQIDTYVLFKQLKAKFNLFLIKKPYSNVVSEVTITEEWEKALGKERILRISNAKACIDVILGAIALTSKKRTLDEYVKDMTDRGQNNERIEEVVASLKLYWDKICNQEAEIITSSYNYNNYNQSSFDNELDSIASKAAAMKLIDVSDSDKEYITGLKKLKNIYFNSVPVDFICPISHEIFFDPVMVVDGTTFERCAIDLWLKTHAINPITKQPLDNTMVIPNLALKKLVRTFYNTNKDNL